MEWYESKVIVGGRAEGEVLFSNIPLSFWGGVNMSDGKIMDVRHDLHGQCIKDKVLCIPYDKGSCSGSGIMLEMIRRKTAPLAILCVEAEPVLSLGSVMGNRIYQRGVVIHTVTNDIYQQMKQATSIAFDDEGKIGVTTHSR